MRRFTLIALATLAASAAGCQESGFDERRETERPLKVQHALGESKVPGQAKRAITLTVDALDDALAVGVRPLRAAVRGGRVPAYLRSRARGVQIVPPVTELDVEAIDAAQPDLILASAAHQSHLYNRLRRIAPTVMTENGGVEWKLDLRLHGEALGRTNDAEDLLTDYDRRAARVRRELGSEPRRTEVSVVQVTRRGLRAAGLASFPGSVLGDLDLSRPPAQDRPRPSEIVPPERMSSVDGDLLLVSVARGAGEALRRLEATPEWRRLRAVRARRVARVEGGTWWSGGGILAARAALRDIERALDRR
ncbi:MAG: ABC transporter substrate-binding protein [Thermoleophilaceae bacterium]|nr:ABC transporter substrate-binding protein [Thermoleophilaceae bacterium]